MHLLSIALHHLNHQLITQQVLKANTVLALMLLLRLKLKEKYFNKQCASAAYVTFTYATTAIALPPAPAVSPERQRIIKNCKLCKLTLKETNLVILLLNYHTGVEIAKLWNVCETDISITKGRIEDKVKAKFVVKTNTEVLQVLRYFDDPDSPYTFTVAP